MLHVRLIALDPRAVPYLLGMPTTSAPRPPAIGDHATMAYTSTESLIAELEPFLRDGLAAGDSVIYVCHDHSPDQVRRAIDGLGAVCSAALRDGRVVILSADETFFSSGRFNVEESLNVFAGVLREAVARQVPRIRAVVEMSYLSADVPGIERAVEFEARANEVIPCAVLAPDGVIATGLRLQLIRRRRARAGRRLRASALR